MLSHLTRSRTDEGREGAAMGSGATFDASAEATSAAQAQ
jgi:hypothetical protein